MTSFLFWNINRKLLTENIARLALGYEIDVLILNECSIEPTALLRKLNYNYTSNYHYALNIGCEKFHIYTKFPDRFIVPILEDSRLTIRHLKLPGITDILLACIHFPGKLHWVDESQLIECGNLSRLILEAERIIGHSKTILVGDFNMNPFEPGIICSGGLHAVMCKKIAAKKTRVVQGKNYPFFYNPMWGLFGDETPGPPGTYYYDRSEHCVLFWNIFDQVLIRPDLLDLFDNKTLKILDSDTKESFITEKGLPDKDRTSDHLPIFFKLNL